MSRIVVCGDAHGNMVEHVSNKAHPIMGELTSEDYLIVAGDFGIPFGTKAPYYEKQYQKQDKYQLEWLAAKPYTVLVVGGNHEDYDFVEQLPLVYKCGVMMRQMVFDGKTYDNIFYIDTMCSIHIDDMKILCIPGAESRDIWNLFDPANEDFDKQIRHARMKKQWFRIKGWSWWEQETKNLPLIKKFIIGAKDMGKRFTYDFIISHDSPACFVKQGIDGGMRVCPTDYQKALQDVYDSVDFDLWIHGHQHIDREYMKAEVDLEKTKPGGEIFLKDNPPVICLFDQVLEIGNIEE